MEPYTYTDLSDPDSIRLVWLRPGKAGKTHVDIETVNLDSSDRSEYEALSYVWGEEIDKVDILIGRESKVLSVTRNLAIALKAFLTEQDPRVFWIDAICIDQSNLDECNHQVGLMTRIYQNAARVTAWIGPGSPACSRAMESVRSLTKSIEMNWVSFEIGSEQTRSWEATVHEILDLDGALGDLETLLSQPWFGRLWVWQEIRVANPTALVKCGQDEVPWLDFHKAIFIVRRTKDLHFSKRMLRRLAVVVQMKNMASSTALTALTNWTRSAACKDERDRVYAVRGMISEKEAAAIDVDYKKPFRQVYLDVATNFITKLKSLDLLTCCRLETADEGLPSWVPNWARSSEKKFAQILNPDASGRSACEATILPGSTVLRLRGRCCCVVRGGFRLWDISAPEQDVVAALSKIAHQFDVDASYNDGEEFLGALAVTLEFGSVAENFEPMPVSQLLSISQAKSYLEQVVNGSKKNEEESEYSTEVRDYLSALSYKVEGWTFFWTDTHIGLSPADITKGDMIYLFLGSRSLLGLRATSDNKFQVLGEAYVHGAMRAEGLLSPIPSGWRRVAKLDQRNRSYRVAWRREHDGVVSFQTTDPRLGPLPSGWSLKQHENADVLNLYENRSTGIGVDEDMDIDPRLSSHELANRGVVTDLVDLC